MVSSRFPLVLGFAVAQLILVGWLDYVTTYEISVSILYYFPIAYAAWFLGGGWSFGFGFLCAATITWAEIAGGRTFSKEWMVMEVASMRLLGFGFVAFSFNYFKRTIDREKDKLRRLEGSIAFCNCCARVRDVDGNWTDLKTVIQSNPILRGALKVCPECSRKSYADGVCRTVPAVVPKNTASL